MARRLKNWLKSYVEFQHSSEAPESLHFWTGVSTIASALRRRVWIDMRKFQWTPNFYIILVGPPGVVTKSTTVRGGEHLLRKVPGIYWGPNSLTWQYLTKALSEAQALIPLDKSKGFEQDYLPMACVTCSVSELGTLLQVKENKMLDVFTDLWDGQIGSWAHGITTKGKTELENPWLNIIAATTPSWLQQNFTPEMMHGGLASRIIWVFGDKKRELIPYPGLVDTPEEYKQMEEDLVSDLIEISEMLGEYVLHPDAVEWGIKWYTDHWTKRPEHLASTRYEGYLARKQTHIHKLAMVIAASYKDELLITQSELRVAETMVTMLEQDMIKVFQSIGMTQNAAFMRELISLIAAHGEINQDELWAKVHMSMDLHQFKDALDAAIRADFVLLGNRKGRPVYCINMEKFKRESGKL